MGLPLLLHFDMILKNTIIKALMLLHSIRIHQLFFVSLSTYNLISGSSVSTVSDYGLDKRGPIHDTGR
jgi:hypothetical protein